MAVQQEGSTKVLEVSIQKGPSIRRRRPRRQVGQGSFYPSPASFFSGCLAYDVGFEPGFEFAKEASLPGLYGGEAPSGVPIQAGAFLPRYMWRTAGAGEVYAYVPKKPGEWRSISPGA